MFFLTSSPEEKVKQMEKKVNELIEESCFANDRGEYPLVRETLLPHTVTAQYVR